ncbi:class I SAM-dependent methyltransferase [Bacillota bacterium Lsc_1132]
MKDYFYEKLLNIKTAGEQQGFNPTRQYHRYEPTPYMALEELMANYKLKSSDRIVDFGCGKGRLNFFFHYTCGAAVVGVEMNETFCQKALDNLKNYRKKTKKIQFFCGKAEDYPVDPRDNRFYFFNPFSVEIFRTVINNLLLSYEAAPREMELILYYPADDYLYFLEKYSPFELKMEVGLQNLYEHDPYERFLIYRFG